MPELARPRQDHDTDIKETRPAPVCVPAEAAPRIRSAGPPPHAENRMIGRNCRAVTTNLRGIVIGENRGTYQSWATRAKPHARGRDQGRQTLPVVHVAHGHQTLPTC